VKNATALSTLALTQTANLFLKRDIPCNLLRYFEPAEIGLEPTPDEYIARLVSVFREVRRVLRSDGSFWLNIGDSYARNPSKGGSGPSGKNSAFYGDSYTDAQTAADRSFGEAKEKDLLMIPAAVAIALRADGWYLRSNIAWTKGSVMPESVKDRPSSAHESIFMLTKTTRYFYDGFAVAESPAESSLKRITQPNFKNQKGGEKDYGNGTNSNRSARKTLENFAANPTRQLRNHWHINPEPLRDAHFAAFPTRLASRCVQAATSEYGCCGVCGAPYKRIIALGEPDAEHMAACGADSSGGYDGVSQKDYASAQAQDASATKARILAGMRKKETVGWEKTCACDCTDVVPALVLDPFSGAGTTALCAVRLGRDAIGIDLNSEYHEIGVRRIANPDAKCLDTNGERLPFREGKVFVS
jgi:DNA modification methylase